MTVVRKSCVYLEVRAKGGQHNAMAGELLASTAQGHITEGVVEPQAVEALQDGVGVPGLHKQVVLLAAHRGRGGGCSCVLLDREGAVYSGRRGQHGVDGDYFSHFSLCSGETNRQHSWNTLTANSRVR